LETNCKPRIMRIKENEGQYLLILDDQIQGAIEEKDIEKTVHLYKNKGYEVKT